MCVQAGAAMRMLRLRSRCYAELQLHWLDYLTALESISFRELYWRSYDRQW
jgi:hypothetical protein